MTSVDREAPDVLRPQASLGDESYSRRPEGHDLLLDAEATTRPLELDPYRGKLFELFVTAHAAGLLVEGGEADLTADGISGHLASRWNLADVAQASVSRQEKLPTKSLGRMRMLWSFLRMWMEWGYAWDRWPEFHDN